MRKGLLISRVEPGSIGEELEASAGDVILQVDGYEVRDVLDFQYLTSDGEFSLFIQKPDGEIWELEIQKGQDEVLGLTMAEVAVGGLKMCRNRCVFCFVDQMPPGMRTSLYAKDDDYRSSVLQGSYITLSNLSANEIDRIIAQHISPLYVSVHAWDPAVRRMMMGGRRTGELPKLLRRLAGAGITLQTQIVLVPGYNDGAVLRETVKQLASLFPAVRTIGIVPVGLTRFRSSLASLRPVSRLEAREILTLGRSWQEEYKRRYGRSLVYFSDEFYCLAGEKLPSADAYDEFEQIENGIGMMSKLAAEWAWYKPFCLTLAGRGKKRKVHLVTGVLAGGFFKSLAAELAEMLQGLTVEVHEVVNRFFGETVTVAGLLTAQDIAAQLKDLAGEPFLIPRVMLRDGEDVFLDDHDLQWLEQKINGKGYVIENDGRSLLEGLTGQKLEVPEFGKTYRGGCRQAQCGQIDIV